MSGEYELVLLTRTEIAEFLSAMKAKAKKAKRDVRQAALLRFHGALDSQYQQILKDKSGDAELTRGVSRVARVRASELREE